MLHSCESCEERINADQPLTCRAPDEDILHCPEVELETERDIVPYHDLAGCVLKRRSPSVCDTLACLPALAESRTE